MGAILNRGGDFLCGTMSLVAWPAAPSGDQLTGGKYRPGNAIGPMSSFLAARRHEFPRKRTGSNSGGGVCALRERWRIICP